MLEPYRMFYVNFAFLILIFALAFFLRYVFPKRKIPTLIFIVLFSLPPILSNFRVGVLDNGQFQEHVITSISFYKSLSDGDFFPRWSGNACSGYGCPLFSYQYQLIYYLTSLFHFIGFSFLTSMKFVITLSYIASGITMYIFAKKEFGENSAFATTIFYLFAPFHLGSMHHRGSYGELISFAIIPLVFYFLKKTYQNPSHLLVSLSGGALFLLMLSHQAVFLATIPLIFLYVIILCKNNLSLNGLFGIFSSFIIGALISAYRWIPMMFEKDFIRYGPLTDVEFQPLTYYLWSPFNYRFGLLFQGNYGELYPIVGYFHLLFVGIAILFIIKKLINKKYKFYLISILTASFVYFFMMLEYSRPIWVNVPVIVEIANAWRLIIQIAFLTSIITGIITFHIKSKKLVYAVCIVLITSTILNWGSRYIKPDVTDSQLMKLPIYKESPLATELTTPVWVDTTSKWIGNRTANIERVGGEFQFKELKRTTTQHEYIVSASSKSIVAENTYYYPGWKLYINNHPSAFSYTVKGKSGLMIFAINPGIHKIVFQFEDTPIRKTANTLSLVTVISLIFINLLLTREKLLIKK